ncbi:MAG: DUF6701 domain-containing protein [Pseudomonadota bacterium]
MRYLFLTLLCFVSAGVFAQQDPPAETVGDWHFDESVWDGIQNEVIDSSGNDNDGLARNNADTNGFLSAIEGTTGTCRYGTFDGTNYAEFPDLTALANEDSISLSFWFKGDAARQNPNNNEAYQTLLVLGEGPTTGNQGRFEVYRSTARGSINFEIRTDNGNIQTVEFGDQTDGEPQLFDGEWRHLAATYNYDDRELTLYIDGSVVATTSFNDQRKLNAIGGSPNLYVGAQQFQANGLVGELDEVTVATGVYTENDVTSMFTRTRPCGAGSQLPQCTVVWPSSFDPSGNAQPQPIQLPDRAGENTLTEQLQPTDYLRVGNFGNVGENYQTDGQTSRVYIDGNLTIQSGRRLNTGGNPNELIFIVTGNLTLQADVRINGFVYVQGDFNYSHANAANSRTIINGAVSVGGASNAQNSGLPFDPEINYQTPEEPLDGGQFCAAEPPGPPEPVLNWRLNSGPWDGSANEVLDSSGNDLNGQTFGGVTYQPAGTDSAIPTDGSGFGTCGYGYFERNQQQYVEIADQALLDFNNEFTIGLWVKPTEYPNTGLMTLFSKDENYEVHLRTDGTINWWWNNSSGATQSFDSSGTVPLNQWSYVAVSYRDGDQTIFINGSVAGSASFSGGLRQNDKPLQLGADQNFGGRYYQGYIDEFSVFGEALTQAEIQQLQQQTTVCGGPETQCYNSDLDDETIFGQQWSRTTVSGSFTPQIVDGRARLTENTTNQSTSITLNGTFPAEDNLVELEFKLYAYGGSGADGIAVVFSDATEDAIPGSFGGSLGYAQRNNGDAGFNGGWLGIGFDEFGNFSRATEGRVGGAGGGGLRPNRIVLRGAEQTDYAYLTDSGLLTPGVDTNANTPGPGHSYRIRIDSRVAGESIVSVERDINDGSGYQEIIAPFDIYDTQYGQQPYVPENFKVSFTGATGGSTNIHEFDDIQVCAEKADLNLNGINYYRLEFDSSALTCTGADITVRACEDSDCTSTSSQNSSVDLSLSSAADDWSENPVNFSGSATVQLQKYSAGTYQVAIDSAAPSAENSSRCFVDGTETTDCEITFSDTGFLFTDGPNLTSTDIPKQTAGTAYNDLYLHTVELNNSTLQCQSAIAQVDTIDMRRQCINPNSCISDLSTYPQATMSASSDAGSATLPANEGFVSVPVQFSGGGEALAIDYGDVGEVRLSARATLPNGKVLEGSSESFVWEPAAIGVTSSNPNETFSGDIIARAGKEIAVNLTALNSDGAVTPNFGNELVTERLELSNTVSVTEADEIAGNISGEENFDDPVNGTTSSNSIVYSEVGEPQFVAEIESGDYLAGVHPPVNTPTRTHSPGRYIPDRFEISTSGFASSCEFDEDYFYIGQLQPLDGSTQVSAVNAAGAVTVNYDDGLPYVKTNAELEFYPFNEDSSSTLLPSSSQLEPINTELSWTDGIGTFVGIPEVRYERMVGSPEGPYAEYQLGVQYNDAENGNYYSLIDTSGAALNSNGAPRSYYALNSSGLNLVYGRMQLQNLFGPPSDPLSIKGQAEYWNGTEFVAFEQDVCTAFDDSQVAIISGYDAELQAQAGTEQLLSDGKLFDDSVPIAEQLAWIENSTNAVVGIQQFIFELDVPDFLKVDNDNNGDFDDNPKAEGTFGIYQGNDRQIYWQEVGW